MAYSPFKPYWKFDKFKHDVQNRKQQFAATALVMGLIPLTLKDVAWPERRIVHVTEPLPWLCDILVLALGLRNEESNGLAGYAWNMRRSAIRFMVVTLVICLLACYAALVFNEIYSKRSALGCVVPFFITAWYIVALLPASIHRAFAGRRQALSAIQGADEDWPVQMAWGIYYIAGTLIFASIMAVTIIEMAVWVFLCLAVTGISKVLAFFICLLFEKTGQRN
ncbi:hypothetical protein J3E74DRAFT_467739 [Bipolaris maydis]|nr:hypothetical protein J3E74DRAFT_467739 [Bipolaris maydis]